MLGIAEDKDLLEGSAPEGRALSHQCLDALDCFRLLQTSLRHARCYVLVEKQECRNGQEKERFGGHLSPRNVFSFPQI